MSSAGRPPGGSSRSSAPKPGRPSAAVYRRRRIAVGVVAVALLSALVVGATALARAVGGGPEPQAGPSPSVTATPTPSSATPTPAATPLPGATAEGSVLPDVAALPDEEPVPAASYTTAYIPDGCRRGSLEVTSKSSSTVYGVGGIVTFTVTLRNTGEVPCLVEGGTAALGVVVTSGPDRVWSSTDCPDGSTARPLLLDLGGEEVVRIAWDETRSEPGCAASGQAVGPGTYRGSVTLDGGATIDSRTEITFLVKEA